MEHDTIWVTFAGLVLAFTTALVSAVRYFYRELSDKVSVGEYSRRHEDLERELRNYIDASEKRIRRIERWQDVANGRRYITDEHRES